MEVGLKFNGRRLNFSVKKVSSFSFGLMFVRRKKAKALLFDFGHQTRAAIHSFFVFFPFYAIWIGENGEVVEVKRVNPWRFSVKPKQGFNRLIEVPISKKYDDILKLLDGEKKDL